jgi:uncharacterized protein GlcG (DUF336 family)
MKLLLAGALALLAISGAFAAEDASPFVITGAASEELHDRIAINADTARRIAEACEADAKRHNSRMVAVILNPYGLVIHQHAMDGEGWVSINAAQQKARTALLTRAPTRVLANRNTRDPFTETHMGTYQLSVQEGGLPIIVGGQMIGAIGVGGIPPAQRTADYDEDLCAYHAVVSIVGPQPPLPPVVPQEERAQR